VRPQIWCFWLTVLSAFVAVSCTTSTKIKTPVSEIHPSKEATRDDLISAYNRIAGATTSVNASIEFAASAGSTYSGDLTQYHEFHGFVLAAKPAMIRVIGQAPLLSKNIFDMTCDGLTFHIFIPSKNKFIVGPATLERPAEKPIENLRPQHLLNAFFWTQIPANASVLFEEFNETAARYYILTILRPGSPAEIERKIWFDRADLSLARVQSFGVAGRLVSDIRLLAWQPVTGTGNGGVPTEAIQFPRHIWMSRPHDDYQLEMKVKKLSLNESITAEKFHLEQPAGTELVRLGESGPGAEK
jgi:hypothetical protein